MGNTHRIIQQSNYNIILVSKVRHSKWSYPIIYKWPGWWPLCTVKHVRGQGFITDLNNRTETGALMKLSTTQRLDFWRNFARLTILTLTNFKFNSDFHWFSMIYECFSSQSPLFPTQRSEILQTWNMYVVDLIKILHQLVVPESKFPLSTRTCFCFRKLRI